MKVIIINSVVDYGSTGKIVRDLYDELKNEGNEVKMVYGRHEPKDLVDTLDISNRFSSMIHLGMSRFFGGHGLHSNKATKNLIAYIESFNPDLIHLHNLHGYYLNVPMLFDFLNKRPDIKIVWTLHDCWAFSGSSAYFSFDGCQKWDDGCVICNNTSTYPKTIAKGKQERNFKWKKEKFTQINDMVIVTPSDWLKDLTEKTFLKKYPIKRIYNGFDTNVFNPAEKVTTDKKIILGVSNIWEKRKGLDDFIKLNELISDEYQIMLIGLSEKQIKELPSNIIGIERTDNIEELVSLYSSAYVYLNLSVEETLGMTTVESIACGTPVIVYNQTAVPEVVNDCVGFVVEAGDVKQLWSLIENTDFDGYNSDELREYGVKFDKKNMVDNYINTYKQLLGDNDESNSTRRI